MLKVDRDRRNQTKGEDGAKKYQQGGKEKKKTNEGRRLGDRRLGAVNWSKG
jgi:hypothetical protein